MFNINGRDIPIVHRIIKVHEKEPGAKGEDVLILTKVRRPLRCAGGALLHSVTRGKQRHMAGADAGSPSLGSRVLGWSGVPMPAAYLLLAGMLKGDCSQAC